MKKLILLIALVLNCGEKKNPDLFLPLLGVSNSSNSEEFSSVTFNNGGSIAIGFSSSLARSSDKNPVVLKDNLKVENAFDKDLKVSKFYSGNGTVISQLASPVEIMIEQGKSLMSTTSRTSTSKQCNVLMSRGKDVNCLDYDLDSVLKIGFDEDGNPYLFGNFKEGKQSLVFYEGITKTEIISNVNIYKLTVVGNKRFMYDYYQGSYKFMSYNNGVTKPIIDNSAGGNLFLMEKFPDGNYYYTHNMGGAEGTGLFKYDPLTETKTAFSSNQANWESWSNGIQTNFCSAGNDYLVFNSGKAFYQAITQVAPSHIYNGRRFVYQLYPVIKIVPVDNLHQVRSIYTVDASEMLVGGSVEGSTAIEFRLLRGDNYNVRTTGLTFSIAPKVIENKEAKTIDLIEGTNIHRFDFTSGIGVYSLLTMETEVEEIQSL